MLYTTVARLDECPGTPAPENGASHLGPQQVLQHSKLLTAVRADRTPLLLTGASGSGKSVLLRRLRESLSEAGFRAVLLECPLARFDDVLDACASELGVDVAASPGADLFETLVDAGEGALVLIIDEADAWSDDLLCRLVSPRVVQCGLRVIVCGQPLLDSRLDVLGLRERIAESAQLCPLDRREVDAFVHRQIETMADNNRTFTTEATARVAEHSKGLPGRVIALCQNAMFLAEEERLPAVTVGLVEQVAQEQSFSKQTGMRPRMSLIEALDQRFDRDGNEAAPEDELTPSLSGEGTNQLGAPEGDVHSQGPVDSRSEIGWNDPARAQNPAPSGAAVASSEVVATPGRAPGRGRWPTARVKARSGLPPMAQVARRPLPEPRRHSGVVVAALFVVSLIVSVLWLQSRPVEVEVVSSAPSVEQSPPSPVSSTPSPGHSPPPALSGSSPVNTGPDLAEHLTVDQRLSQLAIALDHAAQSVTGDYAARPTTSEVAPESYVPVVGDDSLYDVLQQLVAASPFTHSTPRAREAPAPQSVPSTPPNGEAAMQTTPAQAGGAAVEPSLERSSISDGAAIAPSALSAISRALASAREQGGQVNAVGASGGDLVITGSVANEGGVTQFVDVDVGARSGAFSCKNGAVVRRAEVHYPNAPSRVPCEVLYSKDAASAEPAQILWRADFDAKYCTTKASELMQRLAGGGWVCETLSGR